MAAFFEPRSHHTKDGKRERWVKLMEERIIPYQVARGIVMVGRSVDQGNR